MTEQTAPISNRRWLYVFAAFFAVVSSLTSWFAPAFMEKDKKILEQSQKLEEKDQTIQSLTKQVETLKVQKTSSRVTWSVKVPVQMKNGTVAYREASGSATNASEVREQFAEQLTKFQEAVTFRQVVTVEREASEHKLTRRDTVGFGLGYSTERKPWGVLEGRIIGDLSLWGALSYDRDKKRLGEGVGGAMYHFF